MDELQLLTVNVAAACTGQWTSAVHAKIPSLFEALNATLQAGNKAFQQQRYDAAVEAYSRALDASIGDAAFEAVVLCNRAAAQLGAGRCVDAVADCFQVTF